MVDREFVRRHSTTVALTDGTAILLRPVVPEDRERFIAAFGRLSRETIERRFMTGLERLSPEMLTYLTELDYRHHFAWAALALDDAEQPGVGVARYIKSEKDTDVAEAAITVIDEFQRRGLGTLLLQALAAAGHANGIVKFRSYVSTENQPVISILQALGSSTGVDSPGVLVSELKLDPLLGRLADLPFHDQIVAAARGEAR